jgi:hypothetical protein
VTTNEQIDRAQLRALLIARVMVGVYLVELLLNLTRPRLREDEPSLTILEPVPAGSTDVHRLFSLSPVVFWTVLVMLVVGLVLQFVAMRYPAGSPPAITLVRAALLALIGPFALIPLTIMGTWPLVTLACLPSTLFVLWLLHGVQQRTRLPFAVLVAAFAWGALIVWGFARACSSLAFGTISAYVNHTPPSETVELGAFLRSQYQVLNYLIVHLSVLTQLATAAGVLLLLVLLRDRIVDVVTGIVIGAAAGLGVNLLESVIFIQLYGSLSGLFTGATAGFEYWIRQSSTLLTGPVAFGAVLGAGLAIASQLADRARARLVAVAALVAATGANLANEIVTGWFAHLIRPHITVGSGLDTLLVSPGILLVVEAPVIILVFLLLRSGLRARAAPARAALTAEVQTGRGAITGTDAAVLGDPALRAWATAGAWRRLGPGAVRRLRRLHQAQLDLATWHWWRSTQPPGESTEPDQDAQVERLRTRVLQLKAPPSADRSLEARP